MSDEQTTNEAPEDATEPEVIYEEKKVDVYNVNEGVFGRDGGPYLDREQEKIEEVRRAAIEKRKPNLNNVPPGTGVQTATASQLIAGFNNTLIAGQDKLEFDGKITAPKKGIAVTHVPVTDTKDETADPAVVDFGLGAGDPIA